MCVQGSVGNCVLYGATNGCAMCDGSSALTPSGQCLLLAASATVAKCASYSQFVDGSTGCTNCTAGYYNSSTSLCRFGCSVLCSSCYGPHYGLCWGCQINAYMLNLHCLPLYNLQAGAAFQLYRTAFNNPSFFSYAASRS
jgi:hypothetical protein